MQLKKLRQERALSQTDLALATGLGQGRISDLERGIRTPSAAVFQKLATALDFSMEDLQKRTSWKPPTQGRPTSGPERRLLSRCVPDHRNLYLPPRRRDFATHMGTVRERFEDVLKILDPRLNARPDREKLGLFLRDVPVDSADEAIFVLHAAGLGASYNRVSPGSLAFFEHAVIDPISRLVVGHRRRPTFGLECGRATVTLTPQVAVRPGQHTIIMDSLIGVHEGTTTWVDGEVDGQGHDDSWDDRRTRALGLPVLRVTTEMLHDPEFARRLLRTLLWIHRSGFQGVVRKLVD